MGYIIHETLHFFVGASLAYVMCNKDFESTGKRALILCFGGIAAISPDITKIFGDILGHSVLLVPVYGLLFTISFRVFVKDLHFLKAWFIFSLTVLIGHIFIDYVGNGVSFLLPLTQEEFSFSVIRRNDEFVLYTLLVAVLIGLFYRKGKLVFLTGIIIVSLYLGGLSVSKIQLEQALNKQYQSDNVNLLITFPSNSYLEWKFMVRTDKVWVNGYSHILNSEIYIEDERKVDE